VGARVGTVKVDSAGEVAPGSAELDEMVEGVEARPRSGDTPARPADPARPPQPILEEHREGVGRLVRLAVSVDRTNAPDGVWRLVGTHCRLVCESGRGYYPLAGKIDTLLDTGGREISTVRLRRVGTDRHAEYDVTDPLLVPAERLVEEGGGEGGWDVSRLVICAKVPSAQELAGKRGRPATQPTPGALRVVWIYEIGATEKVAYFEFRRIVRVPVTLAEEEQGE
jgi:hypothetical protein